MTYSPIPYWWYLVAQEYPILNVVGVPHFSPQYNSEHFTTGSDTLTLSEGNARTFRRTRLAVDTLTDSDAGTGIAAMGRSGGEALTLTEAPVYSNPRHSHGAGSNAFSGTAFGTVLP